MRRPGSLVSARARTEKVISPGRNVAMPSSREISLQCGGRIEEIETRFCCSMSASRSVLERGQLMAMDADALGQKYAGGPANMS